MKLPEARRYLALANKTITPRASSKAIGMPNAPERVSGSSGPAATGTLAQVIEFQAQVVIAQAVRSQAELSCCTSRTRPLAASYPTVPEEMSGWKCCCQRKPSQVQVARPPT